MIWYGLSQLCIFHTFSPLWLASSFQSYSFFFIMGNSCSIFCVFVFGMSWFLCFSYGVDFPLLFTSYMYVGTKSFYSIFPLFQFMCYFTSAGMLLGKLLNSPLLTIDSAARFFYCKVSVSKHLFSNWLCWLCWLVWSAKKQRAR
jgi:hypothetical protein